MQFRQKIEAAIVPLLTELRRELADVRTLDVLNHYQFRIDLAGPNKDKLPDGYWAKGRYASALLLGSMFVEISRGKSGPALVRIDELIEKIYDVYSLGAVYERGRNPGSEKEFLARLGLALRVREGVEAMAGGPSFPVQQKYIPQMKHEGGPPFSRVG